MDPHRIKAYLQVACAGLGFDIGEIWWSTQVSNSRNKHHAIDNGEHGAVGSSKTKEEEDEHRRLRFVQLYTSKSFENRRSMLLNPDDDEDEEEDVECHDHNVERHVLSPRLVDAISKSAQVIWATTRKQTGLTGRSDIPLHTAVGMPVASDSNGNMCVVVMFSPYNVQSTDDALEYLQSISRSATSSEIPCLLPAFDTKSSNHLGPVPHLEHHSIIATKKKEKNSSAFGEGVDARFVSIDELSADPHSAEVHGDHDLAEAPKDCFGIPMLPAFAELGGRASPMPDAGQSPAESDVFDEASYGIWTTIMTTKESAGSVSSESNHNSRGASPDHNMQPLQTFPGSGPTMDTVTHGSVTTLDMHQNDPSAWAIDHIENNFGFNHANNGNATIIPSPFWNKPIMAPHRKESLEEFSSAFLDMSVFDIIDVWIPAGKDYPDCLSHVTTVTSTNSNNAINEFKRVSENTLIKFWSGAVGRAFSSGNPVWSANPDVFVDTGRAAIFEKAKILTVLAIPIFSGKRAAPSSVLCCYSFVQSRSVPFVLRFVQQALRLLWAGLDKVRPHQSVGSDVWRDVGPADLGEMAADVEMQNHFMHKKRPRSDSLARNDFDKQRQANMPITREFRSLSFSGDIMNNESDNRGSPHSFTGEFSGANDEPAVQLETFHTIKGDFPQEKTRRSANGTSQFSNSSCHDHVSTTSDGRKRAHVIIVNTKQGHSHQNRHYPQPVNLVAVAPLAMPQPLPTSVVKVVHSKTPSSGSKLTQRLIGTGSGTTGIHHGANYLSNPNYSFSQNGKSSLPAQQQQQQNQENKAQMTGGEQIYNMNQNSARQQETGMQYGRQQHSNQEANWSTDQHNPGAVHVSSVQYGESQQPEVTAGSTMSQFHGSQMSMSSINLHNSSQATSAQYSWNQQHSLSEMQGVPEPAHFPDSHVPTGSTNQQHSALSNQQLPGSQESYMSSNSQHPVALVFEIPTNNQNSEPQDSSMSNNSHWSPNPMTPQHVVSQMPSQQTDPSKVSVTSSTVQNTGSQQGSFSDSQMHSILPTPMIVGSHSPPISTTAQNSRDAGINESQMFSNSRADISTDQEVNQFCMPTTLELDDLEESNGKPCRIEGCNEASVARRPYCMRHSGNRLCEHKGCSKCAQGSTRFCIAHGGGRRCTIAGCDKGARDKYFCAAHGGGKRCKSEGCKKSAVGGSQLCTAHGGGRRCSVDGCDKSAQSSTKYCVKHGGGKKCAQDGCEKVARGRTLYCAAHGGGVRCKLEGCNRVAIGKLQLCRAHGGGSKPRQKNVSRSERMQQSAVHHMGLPMQGISVDAMAV